MFLFSTASPECRQPAYAVCAIPRAVHYVEGHGIYVCNGIWSYCSQKRSGCGDEHLSLEVFSRDVNAFWKATRNSRQTLY